MFGFHEFNWLMPISMAIFWGLIFYVLFSGLEKKVGVESPVDIAKRRFANGDITAEELDEIKKKL
ncbi:SHOCT domain-containing protein [Moritella sp. 24]|uniref:SHOCT domain-containing protein n=1 Tax=Moritella sp. 24 TaxID=2746230 RepID=UPI001BAE1815|nr:SHOCT domain-containing protein [Moritella sp. 24]QUM75688.1 SHOCT domain-containing protein [Moritella sp. 24]